MDISLLPGMGYQLYHLSILQISQFHIFFLTGITPYKAIQPLMCMELHKKEKF